MLCLLIIVGESGHLSFGCVRDRKGLDVGRSFNLVGYRIRRRSTSESSAVSGRRLMFIPESWVLFLRHNLNIAYTSAFAYSHRV